MKKSKLYRVLTLALGLVGLGMLLGHAVGNGTSTIPLWIGGLLILVAAVTFGMSVSAPKEEVKEVEE